jgi:hypothetical protein
LDTNDDSVGSLFGVNGGLYLQFELLFLLLKKALSLHLLSLFLNLERPVQVLIVVVAFIFNDCVGLVFVSSCNRSLRSNIPQ